MCCGVTRGLAFEKFSGSLKMSGMNEIVKSMIIIIDEIINRSL